MLNLRIANCTDLSQQRVRTCHGEVLLYRSSTADQLPQWQCQVQVHGIGCGILACIGSIVFLVRTKYKAWILLINMFQSIFWSPCMQKSGEYVAVKCVSTKKLKKTALENLIREIECLKKVDDPHIVRLVDFQVRNFMWDSLQSTDSTSTLSCTSLEGEKTRVSEISLPVG